ncbi:Myb domain-contaning protein [Phytophthora megakarya]|uniref:Myb domain-contaning protein n=1 Tax=Phytophthora megakarya TaxID=4795 RepID=A0A225USW7_9STRA|nr:Myb domain-contaning protein [Phytophthora megakarya]
MAISEVVQSGLFKGDEQQLIRLPIRAAEKSKRRRRSRRQNPPSERSRQLWTPDEHDRFLEALEVYPSGPWKMIAEHIGTRTARQTMTHAQKYRQKIERRKQKERKSEECSASDDSSSESDKSESEGALVTMDDALERMVLMEFLKTFQTSEIDHAIPFMFSQETFTMVEIH